MQISKFLYFSLVWQSLFSECLSAWWQNCRLTSSHLFFSYSISSIPLAILPWVAPVVGEGSGPQRSAMVRAGMFWDVKPLLAVGIFRPCLYWLLQNIPVPTCFPFLRSILHPASSVTVGGSSGLLSCPVCPNVALLGHEGSVYLLPPAPSGHGKLGEAV